MHNQLVGSITPTHPCHRCKTSGFQSNETVENSKQKSRVMLLRRLSISQWSKAYTYTCPNSPYYHWKPMFSWMPCIAKHPCIAELPLVALGTNFQQKHTMMPFTWRSRSYPSLAAVSHLTPFSTISKSWIDETTFDMLTVICGRCMYRITITHSYGQLAELTRPAAPLILWYSPSSLSIATVISSLLTAYRWRRYTRNLESVSSQKYHAEFRGREGLACRWASAPMWDFRYDRRDIYRRVSWRSSQNHM
jgi:hypothetical protein